ncbi:MAG: sulfatase [Planctomycetota bacterium]|nr:sulfatase [Planctomycetota bacterium]
MHAEPARPNILVITADDLNFDSTGFNGCPVKGITPNLDSLAADGLRFEHAYTPEAICQPSRQMLITGRYPCNYGSEGFHPFPASTPCLSKILHDAGYMNGIFGKVGHFGTPALHAWETEFDQEQMGMGRDPGLYGERTATFLKKAKDAAKPFFLVANSHDPHRPFLGTGGKAIQKYDEAAKTVYQPGDVPVPGFLPDLPNIRKEVAQYFGSVHRLDQTVGAVLAALKDSGQAEHTLVLFASDHGMAFPFSKTTCYRAGTRSPWVMRWPGKIKPGQADKDHMISNVDFMPTILEITGLKSPEKMDGRSFLPLLNGEKQEGRTTVYAQMNQTSAGAKYPSRAMADKRYGYMFNAWAGDKRDFKNESQGGLTWKAMVEAGTSDPKIQARVDLFAHRVPEELYDYETDPHALKNLVSEPAHGEALKAMRAELFKKLEKIGDPMAPIFKRNIPL